MSTNGIKPICLLLAVALCAGISFAAETRVWTLADGTRVEAAFYKEVFGDVMVKVPKGKTHLIRVEDLSKGDLHYIQHNIPPEVSADLDFKTRELPRTEYSRDGEDTTLYTFEVTVERESKLPYQGRLTAELFVLGRERTVDGNRYCVLMHYAKPPVVFPEDGSGISTFFVPDVKFHSYLAGWIQIMDAVHRGKTYLGYILTVMDSSGRVIFTDERVPGFGWMTDDLELSTEKLRALYKENPGSPQSRHFNDSFNKVPPPRIPWFKRANHD